MRSTEFLQAAIDVQTARAAEYDQPGGERSMGRTVEAFNAITGRDLSEAEGWLLLQVLKDVRQWSATAYHHDSALDGVAYSALKAEALSTGFGTITYPVEQVLGFDPADPGQWMEGDKLVGQSGAEYVFVGLAGQYVDVLRGGEPDQVILHAVAWVSRPEATAPWMPYTGGPVPDLEYVEVMTACGEPNKGPPNQFIWGGHGTKSRITHYRPAVKP